jgi:hypothetical protein
MKKLLRYLIPLLILVVIVLRWTRSKSDASELTTRSSSGALASSSAQDNESSPTASGAASSNQREQHERAAETNPKIMDIDHFTEADLVYEHVIHTIVPRGSSVVVAGERDANGKRLFTILTPEAGGAEEAQGQIKLATRTYGLDDKQIEDAGMQTLLGNETRLHNQGEIWSAQDIEATREKWPSDAALSMPTVMLEPGSEGVIEIGSLLGKAPYLHRTKVQVLLSPGGFELKTTMQTFRKP